jgi:ABC-type multidrug transport system ATPase subunit
MALTFENIRYSFDMPKVVMLYNFMIHVNCMYIDRKKLTDFCYKLHRQSKDQGVLENKLELLKGINGAFRPRVSTALMGVCGAGKTTLLDVLAGKKNCGYLDGSITVSGYPKRQETFARVSGPPPNVVRAIVFSTSAKVAPSMDYVVFFLITRASPC